MLDILGGAFAPKPSSRPHKLREYLPLVLIMRNRLKYALIYNEVAILMQHHVLVDVKGPIAILWDIDNCPVPRDVHPEDIAGNIRMGFRAHPTINVPAEILSGVHVFSSSFGRDIAVIPVHTLSHEPH